jgi:hypothetical protein
VYNNELLPPICNGMIQDFNVTSFHIDQILESLFEEKKSTQEMGNDTKVRIIYV